MVVLFSIWNMKTALANVVIGKQASLFRIVGQRMIDYAREIGAKHVIQTRTKYHPAHFAKFEVLRKMLHEGFDRMLFLDIDIYVKPGAPNIFNHYDSAAFSEIPHPRPGFLRPGIAWIRDNLDPLWPADRYFNTGVMVLDQATVAEILAKFDQQGPMPGTFFEQDQLNFIMREVGFPKQRLDQQWNQGCRNEWASDEKLDEAYFLHANGVKDKAGVLTGLTYRYP